MAGLLLGLLACATTALSVRPLPIPLTKTPVVLLLAELCYLPLDMDLVEKECRNISRATVVTYDANCDDPQRTIHALSRSPRGLVLGTLEPELCYPGYLMAEYYNTTLVTWNCPLESSGDRQVINNGSQSLGLQGSRRLSPQISTITAAFARVLARMKWKSVAIIAGEKGWWPTLSQSLDVRLREQGVIPRQFFSIGRNSSKKHIERKLAILRKNPCRVIIICLAADKAGRQVLKTIDGFRLAQDHSTLSLFLDISAIPSWKLALKINYSDTSGNITNLLDEISVFTKKYMLIFTDTYNWNTLEELSLENEIIVNIKRSLESIVISDRRDISRFILLDLRDDDSFRELLNVSEYQNTTEFWISTVEDNFEEWVLKHKQLELECEGCESDLTKTLNVLVILGCSCLFVTILLGAAAIVRNQLLKKQVSKGPYKVLLTASDFVFPQIPDSRRVDEGIEAMLCCWLQQLQEFGGPEVEKPDLLQGSGASIKTPIRAGSSPSIAKQLIVDPRVRYNGDLVQMKPVPTGNGGVELKAKAVELLVLLHGLRHENLNPLIGCLAEPPRAALVCEYCARGSLQDVLQQDDIKLDWSFRLSLLTDLVRGMKYLHSTPIRVHGYLSSRNCVIDARWVLKVTDYGLPMFYEAQGIPPPLKTARELLWTSPELLRHSSLRKKGTQAGDVYSFGIILQEVVVRGEPFCMLALTPEEIIEKVKHPPPLIRPSVSKGAAPPEAINIMRQCWAEQADMRPDFNAVHDQFKKLNHGRKVNIVDTMFQMLEKYSNNLEELIRERTEQLDMEKKKTEQLLNRMLPSSVAEKLKLGMPVDPEEFDEVTIYFSDIVGFTTISAHSTPFQVVDLLNDLYTCFDATINAYNVYKVETIGDAYMVVGGLPVRVPDHAEQIATMALDLLHQSGRFRIRHLPGTPLRLRIGLHSGPCCAGVVGLTMPRYCLFGDTVNTASRMESTGSAWRIHLSEATKERLERAGGYELEYRGPTEVKGKGPMPTYWLLGKSGFDKPLPKPPSVELDESLIISKCSLSPKEVGTPGTVSPRPPLEETGKSSYAGVTGSSAVNPSFMKTMEHSKFSSLAKTTGDNEPQTSSSGGPSRSDYHMVKSTSTDTPIMPQGAPVSASEVAAALLGASTGSLGGWRRPRRSGQVGDEDISTPYNHYRCLSPKQRAGKLLRRQFSLDRAEEVRSEDPLPLFQNPRLCKQNSAGAADLEKIEEIPIRMPTTSPTTETTSPMQCSLSISADSLMH